MGRWWPGVSRLIYPNYYIADGFMCSIYSGSSLQQRIFFGQKMKSFLMKKRNKITKIFRELSASFAKFTEIFCSCAYLNIIFAQNQTSKQLQ